MVVIWDDTVDSLLYLMGSDYDFYGFWKFNSFLYGLFSIYGIFYEFLKKSS